jgi:hypothetical protein
MTRDDPLLAALAAARQRKEQATRNMRLLLAYAREISSPRPYRLADLAEAAGMSMSGIRSAYTQADIQQAADVLAATDRQHAEAAVTTLLASGQSARECPGTTA